jgi:hypothetical protein
MQTPTAPILNLSLFSMISSPRGSELSPWREQSRAGKFWCVKVWIETIFINGSVSSRLEAVKVRLWLRPERSSSAVVPWRSQGAGTRGPKLPPSEPVFTAASSSVTQPF